MRLASGEGCEELSIQSETQKHSPPLASLDPLCIWKVGGKFVIIVQWREPRFFPREGQIMRELPTIELTEEQADEAGRIRDILAAKSAVVVDYISRVLASKKNADLLGETEFLIRDAVHRLGAEGIDAALAERKKRGTKVPVSCVQSADATPNSKTIGPAA